MLGGEIFQASFSEAVEVLKTRRTSYGGEAVSKLRELDAHKVFPAWPSADKAGILPVADFVEGELRDDIMDVNRCLLPRSQWPDHTPRSRVHATDAEWYRLVKEGLKRGIFEEVAEDKIFRNQHGEMVLNGAMGVDKFKKTDGEVSHLLRFICMYLRARERVPAELQRRRACASLSRTARAVAPRGRDHLDGFGGHGIVLQPLRHAELLARAIRVRDGSPSISDRGPPEQDDASSNEDSPDGMGRGS